MEDIIEIYDPIYRDTNNIIQILLISLIVVIIAVVIFYVVKRIRKRVIIISPEQQYKNTLDKYLELQNKMDELDTTTYSADVTYLFKDYLTMLFKLDFLSTTNQEMLLKLRAMTEHSDETIEDYFLNRLEPAQFGKYEIDKDEKNLIIKNCVDVITNLYTETTGVDND